jgi:4-hydroxybenzoate polyprenyltransferase
MSPMASMKQTDEEPNSQRTETSDLVGVWVTLWIVAWFAAILVAFFFIGAVVGIAAILVGAVVSLVMFVRIVRRSERP